MDTETELKLFIDQSQHKQFKSLMNEHPALVKRDKRKLTNVYFDTPDKQLRKLDFGLRVRTCDGRSEQTLKTAGKVTGGLHARPEYNEEIEGRRPELSLFDSSIWPEGTSLENLQEELNPLFSNTFKRRIWLLQVEDTIVEVALDVGEIEAGDATEAISEVELELVKGHQRHLFELGHQIIQQCQVRLGQASKAKRGYRLATDEQAPAYTSLPPFSLHKKNSVGQAFSLLINDALNHIQNNEQAYLEQQSLRALQEVERGWQLLVALKQFFAPVIDAEFSALVDETTPWMQTFEWLDAAAFRQHILENEEQYMKRLDDKKRLLRTIEALDLSADYQAAEALFHSQEYNRWLLKLSEWIIGQGWRNSRDDRNEPDANIRPLARIALDDCWSQVIALFGSVEPGAESYVDNMHRLEHALLSGVCFRRLFVPDAKRGYRGPWFDMLHGCLELSLLSFIEERAETVELKDRKSFERWLKRKRKSWLEVLEQTRGSALQMEPYW